MQPLPGRWQAPPVPLTPTRRGRGARWKRVVGLTLVALVLLLAIFGGLGARRLYAFGQAISPQSPLSSQTGFMSGSQRVNVVVLGYGGSGHDGAYLTDSLMVISLVPSTGATTLISVPRDLWVQVPPDSGQYGKLNTAYQTGLDNGYGNLPAGKLAGGALAARKVSDVTGLNVQYWVTIDFTGFRKLVDALGGVEINVPTAFTANYPINDDPQINAGWKTIHFNAGPQHMTGEQAIEYARARYVTDPVSEGTDFARSARQQLLIRAMLARARQVSAWPGLANAADALQGALYTNLSLADLGLFGQKMSLNNAHRVGLSNQNVLMDAQSSDGQSILLPQNDDWTAVQSYVSQHLAP
jgi:LCP family protein required for cell wall assembly